MQSGLAGAFALGALALELAGAADRGGALAGALLRRLLVMTAQLHLAVDALALQLLLQRAQRLLDIIVANDDLHTSPVTLLVIVPSRLKYLKTLTFSSAARYRPPEAQPAATSAH